MKRPDLLFVKYLYLLKFHKISCKEKRVISANNETDKPIYKTSLVASIIVVIVITVTLQSLLQKPKIFVINGIEYKNYNNYVIFKQSYFHLRENKDLTDFCLVCKMGG
jgi:hypothetical protein